MDNDSMEDEGNKKLSIIQLINYPLSINFQLSIKKLSIKDAFYQN